MNSRPAFLVLIALAALLAGTIDVSACAACFGKSDSKLAEGMNAGIFALLVFVGALWLAFASFFVFIVRRAKSSGEPLPGEQDDPQHN